MGKIFKNMIPYWKTLIIVLLLLFVQAWCDLSLPSYTSDIIDVGILNSGVEHVLPMAVTEREFEAAKVFMTDEELTLWEESYEKQGEIYVCTVTDEEKLARLDEKLGLALLVNAQMTAVDETTFRKSVAAQTGTDEQVLNAMSLEQIGALMNVELVVSEREVTDEDGNVTTETYVDMRDIFTRMATAGVIDRDLIFSMREELQKTVDTMGSSLTKSMGIAYAICSSKDAGVDVDTLQTDYLWSAGLKMVGMALLMGVATVLVGFLGARIGAGIGRDLRGKVFEKVVGFSNAQMDQFSTASLITRSTNDIQQVQMVSAMLIRMVAYAPILGIGGVIKVIQTGAGMSWILSLIHI